jgi:hypothetical protein
MIVARYGLVLACLLPGTAAAQGDALSLVGAFSAVGVGGRDVIADGGIGYELQVRFAPSGSRSSLGAGVYSTVHPFAMVEERGSFIELRVDVGADSSTLEPYLTARLSRLRPLFGRSPSRGRALGAGGGAVFQVAPRLHLDGSAIIAHVWQRLFEYGPPARGIVLTVRMGAAVRVG